ncbi:hypothetical protein GCM10011519_20550 [Marmoricola endophyticus]|uniref:DUF1990 domain-containing protein n=1 Tax=Marmoricola endophyticus TaxID=2040280 RepID=A0A917F5U5_9ACTN|nr:DUF1990 domain-containing protein [Marmoricola endophyticus]GGF46469.1 hypothetical protein GCM10011519_20550 [Marmoricola endophyticus]
MHLDDLTEAPLTYAEVGATYDELPDGYHHLTASGYVGSGRARFADAARVLLGWEMHRRAGLTVRTREPSVTEDAVAILGIGVGPLRVSAPVRVVRVVDESDCQGFAYGTLPGHPECGEERFEVRIGPDERVTARIAAFSRPGTRLAGAVGPLGRGAQSVVTRRYLAALAR